VKVWDLANRRERATLEGDGRFLALAFAPDGSALAAGGDDRVVRFWNVQAKTISELPPYTGNKAWVSALAFTSDSRWLISGGGGPGALRVTDRSLIGFTEQSILPGRDAIVTAVAVASDDQALFTADQQGHIVRWDLKLDKRSREFQVPGPVSGLSLAPDGRHLAIACGNGIVCLVRVPPPSSATDRPKASRPR
jgi:WD40 repeat protein